MKNLKKEIEDIIWKELNDHYWEILEDEKYRMLAVRHAFEAVKQSDLVELFRSWALECVGDNTNVADHSVTSTTEVVSKQYYWIEGYNQAKQEIREKIEEVTK